MSSLEEPIRYRFSSLQGLRSLSLANVDVYDSGLIDVCSLPRLESLDISNTSITNLTPLLGLKDRLRSLTLHQLKRLEMSTAQLLGLIRQLDVLQVSGRVSSFKLVRMWLLKRILSQRFPKSCLFVCVWAFVNFVTLCHSAPGHQ